MDDQDYQRVKAKYRALKAVCVALLRHVWSVKGSQTNKQITDLLQMICGTGNWEEAAQMCGWELKPTEDKQPGAQILFIINEMAHGKSFYSQRFPRMSNSQDEALLALGLPVSRVMVPAAGGGFEKKYTALEPAQFASLARYKGFMRKKEKIKREPIE